VGDFNHYSWYLIIGVGLTSVFFTLFGLGVAVRHKTLNGFFLSSIFYTTLFFVPLLGYLNIVETPLYYLLPTQASLELIQASLQPIAISKGIGFIFLLLIWIWIAYHWAYRSFQKYVIKNIGGGS
jgi:fluoroquinolone transport system permease protein